jgi:hypothetical protein
LDLLESACISDHPGAFCVPGQTFCGSFNFDNWTGQQPIWILNVTFGDGSHPQNWAVVSDTGGKAEVLDNSFVGPTDCTHYGGPYCIYPWFSWDGAALNYGVTYPNTVDRLGQESQFRKNPTCPEGRRLPGEDLLRHDHPVASGETTRRTPAVSASSSMLTSRKRCGPVGAGGQAGAEWRDQWMLCSQTPCGVRKCARRLS